MKATRIHLSYRRHGHGGFSWARVGVPSNSLVFQRHLLFRLMQGTHLSFPKMNMTFNSCFFVSDSIVYSKLSPFSALPFLLVYLSMRQNLLILSAYNNEWLDFEHYLSIDHNGDIMIMRCKWLFVVMHTLVKNPHISINEPFYITILWVDCENESLC